MKLTGRLTAVGKLSGTLTPTGGLRGVLTGGVTQPLPYYEGAYEITPSATAQTLNTEQKSMAQNKTVGTRQS